MSLLGGIELAPLKTSIKVDIKSFKSEMDKVKSEAVTKAKEVSKQMESNIKMSDKMSMHPVNQKSQLVNFQRRYMGAFQLV